MCILARSRVSLSLARSQVDTLDLRDNRLTDAGLAPIIQAVCDEDRMMTVANAQLKQARAEREARAKREERKRQRGSRGSADDAADAPPPDEPPKQARSSRARRAPRRAARVSFRAH